jgi:hypothetical protein
MNWGLRCRLRRGFGAMLAMGVLLAALVSAAFAAPAAATPARAPVAPVAATPAGASAVAPVAAMPAGASAAPTSGPAVSATSLVTYTGTIRLIAFDSQTGASSSHWALETRSRVIALRPRGIDLAPLAGWRVRVRGAASARVLRPGAGGLRVLSGPSRAGARFASASHTTIVVLLNVNGNSPSDAATAMQQVFSTTDPYSVKEYWLTQTYGQVDLVGKHNAAGDVIGPYAVDTCDLTQAPAEATTQAQQHGYDLTAYQSVIWVFPTTCGGGGLGEQPGHQVWTYGLSRFVISHELGHNFGNPHASTLRCYTDPGKTTIATLSSYCDPPDEYGDPFDPMGSGGTYPHCTVGGPNSSAVPYEMDPWRKLNIGAMSIADAPTENVAGTHTYTLAPLENASGLRLIRLPDGRADGRMFDLSFRQPTGTFDQWYDHPIDSTDDGNRSAIDGVRVAMDPSGTASQTQAPLDNSYLLDMTPSTGGPLTDPCTSTSPAGCDPCVNEPPGCSSNTFFQPWLAENGCTNLQMTGFEDAPLATGNSWSDPLTGITIAIGAVGASGAQVTISYAQGTGPDVSAPTAPGSLKASLSSTGVVTLSWSPSVDSLDGVSHYVLLRDGKVIQGNVTSTETTDKPAVGRHAYTVRAADAAGNLGPESAQVAVTIQSSTPPPPPPPRCVVPRLRGLKLAAARTALQHAHCALGKVRRRHSRRVRRGRVISQSPAPGKREAAGSKVAVVLSRGR